MKKNCICFLALFFIVITSSSFTLAKIVLPIPSNKPRIPSKSGTSTLQFGTYASFNDPYTQCLGQDGNYYWGALFQTFKPTIYAPCHTQMLSDINFLSQHNIKTIRLWPVLSTFAYNNDTQSWSSNFNSSIRNLDQYLNSLAKHNIKAYLTLMSTPDCGDLPEITTNLGYYFNPALINDQGTQDQFIQAFQAFITRYQNNPTIAAYDLVNEASLVLANPPTKKSQGYCNLPYDTANFTKTQALLTRIYTTAKSIDTLHSFTYSFDHLYPASSAMVDTFRPIVDYYDFHAYANDPTAFYQSFSTYDKPVIHGEVGVYSPQYDKNGNDCQGVGLNTYDNTLPAMSLACQRIWLANAQAFVQQAQLHGVQALFFQLWPSTKAYGIRLYAANNNFTGYQLTSAGTYIFGLAGG